MMKKTYISPVIEVICIEEPTLLAGSVEVSGITGLEGIDSGIPEDDDEGIYAD